MRRLVIIQRHATEGYIIARHSFRTGVMMIAERIGATPQEVMGAFLVRGSIRADGPLPSVWSL